MRDVWIWIALGLILFGLFGCVQTDRQEQGASHTVRTYREEGTQGGVAFAKTGVEETSSDHQSTETKTIGVDPGFMQAIISGAATAATGGGYGPIAAAMGSVAAAAGAAWLNARKQAQAHKQDADEAWARVLPPVNADRGISNG